jgi:TolB-like protein
LFSFYSSAAISAITFVKAADTVSHDLKKADVAGVLAVVAINSQSSELSLQIIRTLENKLVRNHNLQIVSRTQIEIVIAEQDLGASGYVDDDSAQKLGHILGAKYVLVGEITKPEDSFFLNIQVLETETARLIYSDTFEIDKTELKKYEMKITPNAMVKKPRVLRF